MARSSPLLASRHASLEEAKDTTQTNPRFSLSTIQNIMDRKKYTRPIDIVDAYVYDGETGSTYRIADVTQARHLMYELAFQPMSELYHDTPAYYDQMVKLGLQGSRVDSIYMYAIPSSSKKTMVVLPRDIHPVSEYAPPGFIVSENRYYWFICRNGETFIHRKSFRPLWKECELIDKIQD